MAGGAPSRDTGSKPAARKNSGAVVVRRKSARSLRLSAQAARSATSSLPRPVPRRDGATTTERSSPSSPCTSIPAAPTVPSDAAATT